jgi:hypothetical protein
MPNANDAEVEGTPIPKGVMLRVREESDTKCRGERQARGQEHHGEDK